MLLLCLLLSLLRRLSSDQEREDAGIDRSPLGDVDDDDDDDVQNSPATLNVDFLLVNAQG